MKKRQQLQLTPIVFCKKTIDYIDSLDLSDYKGIWNVTSGYIIKVKKEIREHYISKQQYRCAYCRVKFLSDNAHTWDVEHIIPKSKGYKFLFEPRNLVVSCRGCNGVKAADAIFNKKIYRNSPYPKDGSNFTILHPHFDKFSDHIEVYEETEGYIYKHITPKGEKTILECNLTRYAEKGIFDTKNQQTRDFLSQLQLKINDEEIKSPGESSELRQFLNDNLHILLDNRLDLDFNTTI